jgi:RNA polymerase sigma-70 factor, ECF subfamily
MRVLGTPEDAEDALQDGLLAAWHKLKTFEGRSQFSTWLTRIVINCSLMHLRRRRAHTVASMDEPSGEPGESIVGRMADPRPTPEEACAQREQRQILREKLQKLPVPYRTALWLCDVKGMRAREAAHVLRIPLGTLKSQVVRGRRMISRQVHEGKAFGQ